MKILFLLFISVYSLGIYAQKDTVCLKTGEMVIGTIVDDDGGSIVIKSKGDIKSYSKQELGTNCKLPDVIEIKAYSLSSVITVKDVQKDILYSKSKQWLTVYYKSSKDVIQLDDKENGIIIGKGNFVYHALGMTYASYEGWVNYTFKIQVKDGRLKFEIYDFIHENKPGNARSSELGLITTAENYTDKGLSKGYHNNTWKDIKKESETHFNNALKNLTDAVSQQQDNW